MIPRGWQGWAVLAVSLAVPAFMFWKWWRAVNPGVVEVVASKPRASPFGGENPAYRLDNPIRAQSPGATRVSVSTAPALPSAPSSVPAPPSAPAAARQPAPAPPTAAQAQAPAGYNPRTPRDPTLSPNDVKRLAQLALEREAARRQAESGAAGRRPKKRAEPPIESRLRLMGIISSPRGDSAIVNDVIVHEGDRILGARVRRIAGNTVTFEHKKRVFSKSMRK